MNLKELNNLSREEAYAAFEKCCGAEKWINAMVMNRPYLQKHEILNAADKNWKSCTKEDWLQAFRHHPKIGDLSSLSKKYANTKKWAGNEQKGVEAASLETLKQLAEGNRLYEAKFGFIFIVFATGKSAQEMLTLLQQRLPNERTTELRIAAAEQHKITKIRLEKLLD